MLPFFRLRSWKKQTKKKEEEEEEEASDRSMSVVASIAMTMTMTTTATAAATHLSTTEREFSISGVCAFCNQSFYDKLQ
jgi:hypothetical protein